MNKKLISAVVGLPLLAAGAAAYAASGAPATSQQTKTGASSAECCAPFGTAAKTASCCPEQGAKAKTAATSDGCCDGSPCCP